jgi:hypothetical protein
MSAPHPPDNTRLHWNIDFRSLRPAELHSADFRDYLERCRGWPHVHVVVAASLCRGAHCVATNTATQRRGNRGRVGVG